MVPSHSLIPWSNLRQIISFLFLCIENPHILTSTCSGIVITICLPSSVIGTLTHMTKQFAQNWSSSTRKSNTLRRPYPGANTPNGLWTKYKVSSSQANGRMVTFNRTTQTRGGTSTHSYTKRRNPTKDKPSVGHIVIPYTQGLEEFIKKICGKYDILRSFQWK